MTSEQADRIIELLESIDRKLGPGGTRARVAPGRQPVGLSRGQQQHRARSWLYAALADEPLTWRELRERKPDTFSVGTLLRVRPAVAQMEYRADGPPVYRRKTEGK